MGKLSTVVAAETEVEIEASLKRKAMLRLNVIETLQDTIREAKTALALEVAAVEKIREIVGVKSFALNGFTVTRVTGDSSRLDRKKMKAAGVTDAQIENWTTTKPKKAYTKVTAPGEKPEAQEDDE